LIDSIYAGPLKKATNLDPGNIPAKSAGFQRLVPEENWSLGVIEL
jgi:hypothetical protein